MGLVVNEVVVVEEAGKLMAFHVPTSGFWEIDPLHRQLIEIVESHGEVAASAFENGLGKSIEADRPSLQRALGELQQMQLLVPAEIRGSTQARAADQAPLRDATVGNVVIHVAHTCNLACTYCYAESGKYGGPQELMTQKTALGYVDWLFDNNPDRDSLGITFFGGEPLINFPAVEAAALHALDRAEKEGKTVRFAMTTNGTLITDKVAKFLARIGCSVTLSLDGDPETNDRVRPFHSGRGSYDLILRRVKPLRENCQVAVRVTVTRMNTDVLDIVQHIMDLGFDQVGASPVDAGDARFDLGPEDYANLLDNLMRLADRYLDHALKGELYGFSNIHNIIKSIHAGHNKDYPCGAAINMVAGAPNGDMHACHRFVGDKRFQIGTLEGGIDEAKYFPLIDNMHLDNRSDCSACWARYLCSGGCHYVNDLHEGDVRRTHGDHCDFLRSWYFKGLEVYTTIANQNPEFIQRTIDPGYLCGL